MLLPTTDTALNNDIEFVEQTSNTFFFNIDLKTVSGFTDKREAMIQAIYLILRTERYQYVIFSWNYGIELEDLFGMPVSWVIPEVKRRIGEALLQDTRIDAVDNFGFAIEKRTLSVTFTAHTIYGDLAIEKGVNF